MKVTKQEKLDVSARDYVMQAWRHTKVKILGELRRQGHSGVEIIQAIKKAKKDLGIKTMLRPIKKKHSSC